MYKKLGKKVFKNNLGTTDNLSSSDTFKKEITEELRNLEYHDLKHLVYRMHLSIAETMDVLDMKYFPSKKNRIYPSSRRL